MIEFTPLKIDAVTLVLALLMGGCTLGEISYSPQAAAIRGLTDGNNPMGLIDQSSLLVRQSAAMGSKVFVMVSFSEKVENRLDKCLFVQETERSGVGAWILRGGGGGCSGTEEPPPAPFEVGTGMSGGSGPNDPGYCWAYGLVNQADIIKVRVTWNDGQQQEVAVINSSYLAIRAGEFGLQNIEGLNTSGEVVYRFEQQAAPGKY
jgi:hypothetical protein